MISFKFPTRGQQEGSVGEGVVMSVCQYDDELHPQNPRGGGTDSLKLVLTSTHVSCDMCVPAHDIMQFKFLSNSFEMSLWMLSESI